MGGKNLLDSLNKLFLQTKTMNKTQYKELNKEYLAIKATEPGVENIGGVLVKRLADGSGERTASLSSIVVCRYSGNLIDGTQFDSNENDAMPYPFRVRELIEGWQIALTHMKVGDKWELTIPAELGYGSARVEGIPAYSTLIFTLELLQIA